MSNVEASRKKRKLGDASDVAEMCDCCERTIYRLADAGKMPFGVKVGSLRRWDLDEIEQWIRDGCKPVRSAKRR